MIYRAILTHWPLTHWPAMTLLCCLTSCASALLIVRTSCRAIFSSASFTLSSSDSWYPWTWSQSDKLSGPKTKRECYQRDVFRWIHSTKYTRFRDCCTKMMYVIISPLTCTWKLYCVCWGRPTHCQYNLFVSKSVGNYCSYLPWAAFPKVSTLMVIYTILNMLEQGVKKS